MTASRVNKQIEEKFRKLLDSFLSDNRLESLETDYSSKFNQALAKSLSFINRRKQESKFLSARILLIKCGADFFTNQYLAITNAAFAAESLQGT